MGRETRRRWWLLLLLALGVSLMEVLTAAMIFVLLGLIADPSGQMTLPLVGDIRGLAGDMRERTLLLIVIGVMMAFFVIRALVQIVSAYIISRIIQNTSARLAVRLVRGYMRFPLTFHLQHSSAELIRNSHQVSSNLAGSVFRPLVTICAETLMVIGIFALLLTISPIGTALAVAFVGGTSAILLLIVQPRLKRLGTTAHRMNRETLQSQQQCFDGVEEIKLLGLEESFTTAYRRRRRVLARMTYLRNTFVGSFPIVMQTSLFAFILAFFAVTLVRGTETQGALAILGLFAYAGMRLQPSLKNLTGGLNSIKFASAPTSDLYDDLRSIDLQSPDEAGPVTAFDFEREITLQGVGFKYEGADADALSDVSLKIERGEQIGICGPTGGGKSTLTRLIVGLLAPSEGHILVDGRDISENVRGWQRNLGMVPQSVFLVDDTVRRNIALGVEDDQIDEAAVQEAVHLAQLDSFLEALPEGLDTVVGERGTRLSGGERQRIAIARALYHQPQVLVFDEGTSALDNTTEKELMSALRSLRGSHTILLVAHRLSTVRDADRVIFVEGGRISGIDTYDGLVENNEAFRQMTTNR